MSGKPHGIPDGTVSGKIACRQQNQQQDLILCSIGDSFRLMKNTPCVVTGV
jgi:hypothetical protein